ncbi:MAG: hypothetical protein GVY06_06575 [Alphaproteobacteria bacterium]|jgi:acyl transferase domain-containing protein/3-hydroxymyristoyl/3-hydroxydecanoyl-(acyl carrier protein) dehydratase|nr:hypothetical protein [Alphaproteobacteria bacterium]
MAFEPIAIVGRGCVLPGCLTPAALWEAVADRRSLLTPTPAGHWGLTATEEYLGQRMGGYVTGFDSVFDPARHDLGALDPMRLDPVFRWPLHVARAAMDEAGRPEPAADRFGVVLANLSYPSRAKSDYAGDIWLDGESAVDPRNAFNSGLPAKLVARDLGAAGGAFALDAACASSLYALAIACRKLQSRKLDLALVGAVNAADNLNLHRGFAALQALSPTGRSRPFMDGADGLVPAEGAAAVMLKRASDIEPGETVFAIIRGIGLSNDGQRRGFVAPDEDGQFEAMSRAYAGSGISPDEVAALECHATGTAVGDGVEIASSARAFAGHRGLAVGSLKSNTGHLITVAGLASLLKMIGGFEHGQIAPTRIDGEEHPALAGTPLHLQDRAEPWPGGVPRRAAISNFGFGGNNAHMVLEAPAPERQPVTPAPARPVTPADPVVICGLALMAGNDATADRVVRRLMNPPATRMGACTRVNVDPRFARTPPADLERTEPAQLAMLSLGEAAMHEVGEVAPERAGVLVAMGCAADSTRLSLRERLAARLGLAPEDEAVEAARADISSPISPAHVLGAMPNIPANRLNSALDFRGCGHTVSAEGDSSSTVLELAAEALEQGEADLMLVGASDFASETVRARALAGLEITDTPADISAVLVLKRRRDAEAAGDPILGEIGELTGKAGAAGALLARVYGHAPISEGLAQLALAAQLHARGLTSDGESVFPRLGPGEPAGALTFPDRAAARPSPDPLRAPPVLFWAAAENRQALARKLAARQTGGDGQTRIALTAPDRAGLDGKLASAGAALAAHQAPAGEGIHFGEGPEEGQVAFVFTGSAAAYPRMGRGLLTGFPGLARRLGERFPDALRLAPLLASQTLGEYEQLCAVTLVSQAQTLLLREGLGLEPEAALGLSLGETNALIAFGFWDNPGEMIGEFAAAQTYERHIGGAFESAATAWGETAPVDWANWRIYAPLDKVRAAIAEHPRVEITIIYTPEDCVIGGPPEECRAVARALGEGAGLAMQQHLVVHAEAMIPYRDTWRRLHTRPTKRTHPVRLYANAVHAAYEPTRETVADMLTQQAVSAIDFPPTIEQAYDDGVRTFVEIGPRDTLTRSISRLLGERPHLAVASDRVETSDLAQIAELAAALYADGRKVSMTPVAAALAGARAHAWVLRADNGLDIPLNRAPPKLPAGLKARAGPPDLATSTDGNSLLPVRAPRGPRFTRAQLERASEGKISELFGPFLAEQDGYVRQVRLPTPPLLLVDRITGIDAEPGVEGKGVIWTQTDLREGSWPLQDGRMRPGPLIEAGQADLSLISWMGADLRNADERVYRLLGCEISFHGGGLPEAGETLRYQIEITGHASLSGVRMFFFQYDCFAGHRALFSVRNGQAGFFTEEELAAGKGLQWDAAGEGPPSAAPAPFDISHVSKKRAFTREDVEAMRRGDAYACFGEGFEPAAAHSRPPRLASGKLALFDDVPEFEPAGGPWGRGYLRARAHVPVDAWFYDGHFHNDPCMPGTLMAEAAVQALEFHAAALGLTVYRDGFVFEPVAGQMSKFVCRGQVVPDTPHDVTYEVFIDEVVDGDSPEIHAALLATSDGRKVFFCPRFGVRLVRKWPRPAAGAAPVWIGPQKESRGDEYALQACADGRPSDAFGQLYKAFDDRSTIPRLPRAPFHMVSRVLSVSTRPNAPEEGAVAVAEFDVPTQAFYFEDYANGAMPFSVLLEAMLQPCGWLASHGGFALEGGKSFRNLDGEGTVHREIAPGAGTLRVTTTMTRFSRAGPTSLVFFDVSGVLDDGSPVMDLTTSFGFFDSASLARQVGLKPGRDESEWMARPASRVPVADPEARLPRGDMQMLDAVDHFDPSGGAAGLGLIRARQAIDPYAWYFRAHFFSDPVQPGSLGLDALIQLLKRAALLKGGGDRPVGARFRSLAPGEPIAWTYRGQVSPRNRQVTTLVEITRIDADDDGLLVTGDGSLWCDGLKIYGASGLSVRLA